MMKANKYVRLSLILAISMAGPITSAFAKGTNTTKIKKEELIKRSSKKWSGSFGMKSSKNQDEFSDSFLSTRLDLSYEILPSTEFYTEIIYRRPFTTVQEKVNQYGFEDIGFGFSQLLLSSQFENTVTNSIAGYIEGSLPTSDASRKASLRGSSSAGISTKTAWRRIIVGTDHGLTYNFYRYETVDAAGSAYNSPYMIHNGVSLTLRITNQIKWANAYTNYYLKNFADNEVYIQAYSNSLSFAFNKNFSASIFLSWKDRRKTNNALFDDDTTYTGAGINYAF